MRRHHWAGALVGRKYEVALLEKYKGMHFGYLASANNVPESAVNSPGDIHDEPPTATDLVQHTYNQLYAVRTGSRLGARSGAFQHSVREWQASSNTVSR